MSTIRVDPFGWDSEHAVWPKKVSLVITKVPIRKKDGFSSAKFKDFSEKLFNSMIANSVVFLVCYAPTEDRGRPFEICRSMVEAGFSHIDNIIIEKTWIPGKRSETNLVNAYEFVLFFAKGKKYQIDRSPVREYSSIPEGVLKDYSSISNERIIERPAVPREQTCIGNLWLVQTDSLDDSIPNDLAELLMLFSAVLPGSLIFDPFGGAKSLIKAAAKYGHSLHILEGDPHRFKILQKTLEKINNS